MKYLWLSLCVASCATISEDERFYREYEASIEREKWAACQEIYSRAGKPTISNHAHIAGLPHKKWEVRDDLQINNCHRILKDW